MSSGNPRRPRVAQAIREALGELISSELTDPRLKRAGFISINHVELNKDMSVAQVFVGFYGGDDTVGDAAVSVLNAAAGKLRGPLGRVLKLQRSPELRFNLDQSGEFGVRMSQIIRDDEMRRAHYEHHEAAAEAGSETKAAVDEDND